MSTAVFVTGGTGYIGQQLVGALLLRGHRVRVLTRVASAQRVPTGAEAVVGNVLNADEIAAVLAPGDTIVHLVGTPHPTPSKAQAFLDVDLASARAVASAARRVGSRHVVYVSVAHPAPVMKAYVAARVAGENAMREAGVALTCVRPWYVLGPGHWWPLVLTPLYFIGERVPALRDGARRLGLVTRRQMVDALVAAVEQAPGRGEVNIVGVQEIRRTAVGGTAKGGSG